MAARSPTRRDTTASNGSSGGVPPDHISSSNNGSMRLASPTHRVWVDLDQAAYDPAGGPRTLTNAKLTNAPPAASSSPTDEATPSSGTAPAAAPPSSSTPRAPRSPRPDEDPDVLLFIGASPADASLTALANSRRRTAAAAAASASAAASTATSSNGNGSRSLPPPPPIPEALLFPRLPDSAMSSASTSFMAFSAPNSSVSASSTAAAASRWAAAGFTTTTTASALGGTASMATRRSLFAPYARRDRNGFAEGSAFFDPDNVVDPADDADDVANGFMPTPPVPDDRNAIFSMPSSSWTVAPAPPLPAPSPPPESRLKMVNGVFTVMEGGDDGSDADRNASIFDTDWTVAPAPAEPVPSRSNRTFDFFSSSFGHDDTPAPAPPSPPPPPRAALPRLTTTDLDLAAGSSTTTTKAMASDKGRNSIFDAPPSPVFPTALTPTLTPIEFGGPARSASPSKHWLPSASVATSPIMIPMFRSDGSDPRPVPVRDSSVPALGMHRSMWGPPVAGSAAVGAAAATRTRAATVIGGRSSSPASAGAVLGGGGAHGLFGDAVEAARRRRTGSTAAVSDDTTRAMDRGHGSSASLDTATSRMVDGSTSNGGGGCAIAAISANALRLLAPVDPATFAMQFVPLRKNLLGEGLHAHVYRATYAPREGAQDVPCAVKQLHDPAESQITGLREAALLQMCAHPNILRVVEVVDIANHPASAALLPPGWERLSLANLVFPPDDRLLVSSWVPKPPAEPAPFSTLAAISSESMVAQSSPATAAAVSNDDEMDITPPTPPRPPEYALVLELCEGGSLWSYVKTHPTGVGRRLWMRWARQLAAAVEAMHSRRCVHHDIKPQNILLDEFNGIKLSDLGGAEVVPREGYFGDGIGKGTLAYMAPEMVKGQSYTASIDMYSIGVTLYVVGILGYEPFMGASSPVHMLMAVGRGFWNWPTNVPDPAKHSRVADVTEEPDTRAVNPGAHLRRGVPHPHAPMRFLRFLNGDLVDVGIWDLLKRCLDVDPEQRPTAAELARELRALDGLGDESVAAEL